MALKFKNTKHKETCMLSLSGQKGGSIQNPKRIYYAYIMPY